MYTSTIILSLLSLTLAQYGSSDSSSTSSSSAATPTFTVPAGVQIVKVGNAAGDLTFTPSSISANVGSKVEFVFYPAAHSVAQAAFASPCQPLNDTGFFSGSIKTSEKPDTEHVFTVTVNDTKPIWFYCATPGHCQKGMVGVINAPSDGSKTFDMFKAAAVGASTVAPNHVQGGVLGAQSAVQGSTTGSSPSSTTTRNAGIESRGVVRWTLLGVTGLVAAGIGSLIL